MCERFTLVRLTPPPKQCEVFLINGGVWEQIALWIGTYRRWCSRRFSLLPRSQKPTFKISTGSVRQVNSRECYETLWDPWGDDVETEYLRMTAELAHDRSSSWWIAYVCIYVCTYVRVVPYVCSPWREYNCLFSEFSTHLGFFGTLPDKLQSLSRSGRRSVCRPQLARLVAEVSVTIYSSLSWTTNTTHTIISRLP